MKEIKISDLYKYLDPLTIEDKPAIATATDTKETNGLTIGWAQYGVLWNKPSFTVYVQNKRYSKHIFDGAQYFSVSFVKDEEQLKYFGTVSGRDENKIQKYSEVFVNDSPAPYFSNSRLVVICRIMGKSNFDASSVDSGVSEWYRKEGVHTLYYGEIVKVLVE